MRIFLATALVAASLLTGGGVADARLSCAADPNDLSFRQMIRQHKTGEKGYHVMFLGVVVDIKDVGGKPRGKTIAKLAVAEHPVGFAPLVSRVHFDRPDKGEVIPGLFEFHKGERYVVIADRRRDGTFDVSQLCGRTWSVGQKRFRSLIQFSHQH
jgi:hypothetical protein